MGRLSGTNYETQKQTPIQGGGRIVIPPIKLGAEPVRNWEDMSFWEKAKAVAGEVPKTLAGIVPGLTEAAQPTTTPKEALKLGAKAPFEFAKGIAQVSGQAIGGAALGIKQKITGKEEKINVPILGEISSYQKQSSDLEQQGFSPNEAKALVGINAYLGLMPFAVKGIKSKTGQAVIKKAITQEVPFAETPEGIKRTLKTEATGYSRNLFEKESPKVVKIERPTITKIKEIIGQTEEQKRFQETFKANREKFFEGREQLLGTEDNLNKALIKLNDTELKNYSAVTQGLASTTKSVRPEFKTAIDLWKKANAEIEADLIKRKMLDPAQAENRKWKPIEMITERSRDELKQMGIEPVYYPYMAEDLLKKSDFLPSLGRRTKGGYLKRFTGKLLQEDSYIKDPKIAIPRNRIQVFRDKMNSELVNDIKREFAEKDPAIIKIFTEKPEAAESLGYTEYKPSGKLRFYPIYKEVIKKDPIIIEKITPKYQGDYIKAVDELNKVVNDEAGIMGELRKEVGGVSLIGERGEPLTRASSNPQWYRDFYKEHGRPPSKADMVDLAKTELEKGSGMLGEEYQDIKNLIGELEKANKENVIITKTLGGVRERVVKKLSAIGVSKKVETAWIPKTIASELDGFFKPGAVEKFLRATYDPLIDLWRISVLNLTPRWIYNNFMGNLQQAILGKTKPATFLTAGREMIAGSKIGQKLGMKPKIEFPKGVQLKTYAGGATGESPAAGKLGGLSSETTQLMRPLENWMKVPVLRSIVKGALVIGKPGGKINNVVENWFRTAMYISSIEGKQTPPMALQTVNKFLFDYSGLSRTERMVFRRALPFWNWQKHITAFAFKYPYEYPTRGLVVGAMLQDYIDFINENQKGDENKSILRIKIPGVEYEKKPLYLNIKSAIPYSDVFRTIPSNIENFGRFLTSNPVSKIVLERIFKINSFTGQPFTQPKEKIQYDAYGKEIRPLPSLLRHIGQQLPQVGLYEDLTQPYKKYETGEPKLLKGRIQPIDVIMRIFKYFGINITPMDINKIQKGVERKEKRMEQKSRIYERQLETLRKKGIIK